jgi:hypothetical protein
MAAGWPRSKWRFWSNPFLIVPNAPVIIGTFLSSFSTYCWPRSSGLVLAWFFCFQYVPHNSDSFDIYNPFRYMFIVLVSDLQHQSVSYRPADGPSRFSCYYCCIQMVQMLRMPQQYVLRVRLPYTTLCIYCPVGTSWCSSDTVECQLY